MLAALLASAVLVAAPAPWVTRTLAPANVDDAGLTELLTDGEVIVIPSQSAEPFRALLLTEAERPCAEVEATMIDVQSYPKLWKKMKRVEVVESKDQTIHYRIDLDVFLSPTLDGYLAHSRPGQVVFFSPGSTTRFAWTLDPSRRGCRLAYEMYHPAGKRSDFVQLVQKLEPGVNDSGEVAGALASSRGFASPEVKGHPPLSRRALARFDELSGKGTALRIVRRGEEHPVLITRRRVAVPPTTVAARVRNLESYSAFVDFLDDVRVQGDRTSWHVRYFGGRVAFSTKNTERAIPGGGIEITERVVDGDLSHGTWRWTITPIDGGSAVQLDVDLDVTRGSRVLAMLADQDQLIRDSTSLQVALEFMRMVTPERALGVGEVVVAQRDDTAARVAD